MQPHLKRIEENKRGHHFPGTGEWEEDRKENVCSQRFHLTEWWRRHRGKEMSLSRSIGSYYKLPKSDPNAVYLLPTAIYLLQCCFISANIVWAGQCDNSLFPY